MRHGYSRQRCTIGSFSATGLVIIAVTLATVNQLRTGGNKIIAGASRPNISCYAIFSIIQGHRKRGSGVK